MRNRRLFLFLICFLSAISIKADNTVSVGSDIKLYAPASDDIRKPDLYDIKWRIASGDFNAVTLIGDTQNPVIVRGTAPGTVIISCTARFYNKALWTDPMYSGWITRSASYTVTCTDPNSGGGGGDNPGGGGGDTPGGGGDPSGYKDGDILYDDFNGVDTKYKIINVGQRTAQIGLGYAGQGTAIWKDIKLDTYFIQKMVNGFFITEIANCAFCECKNVKKIFLGESNDRLKRIGSNAFQNCDALTFLTVPNSVTIIDDGAFSLCDNLEEVTIGSSVQSIGASVFTEDVKLKKITVLANTPPNVSYYTFKEEHYSSITVIVPKGSKSKYKNDSYWGKFDNLKEEGESPDTSQDIFINETNFPDENFRKYLLDNGYKTKEDIKKIERLVLNSINIKSLKGIEHFTSLTYLDCVDNQLTTMDLSKNIALRKLIIYGNNIRDEGMDALINSLPIVPTNDGWFEVVSARYMGKNVCKCTKSQVAAAKAKGWIPCMDFGYEYEGSKDPDPSAINETNFPDDNFRNYLLNEGYKTEEDIKDVSYLDLSSKNIKSLKGIEYFTALHTLYCNQNQLTTLDVSNNSALSTLWCSDNQLTALDVSKNTALKELNCHDNQLSALDVSRNNNLETLRVWGNRIFGNAMNNLINSLPFNSTNKEHIIYIISGLSDEENVCTTTQVSEIKKKGWIPTERHGFEIEGSDPTGIMSRISETKETPIYNLNGQRMDKPHKGINIIGGKKVVIK